MEPTESSKQIAAILIAGLRCGIIASKSAAKTPTACQHNDNVLGAQRRTRNGMQKDAPIPAILVTVIALPRAITSKPNTSARYGPPQEVRNVPPTDIARQTGINVHNPFARFGGAAVLSDGCECAASSKGFSSRRRTKQTMPIVASSIKTADNPITGRQAEGAVAQLSGNAASSPPDIPIALAVVIARTSRGPAPWRRTWLSSPMKTGAQPSPIPACAMMARRGSVVTDTSPALNVPTLISTAVG